MTLSMKALMGAVAVLMSLGLLASKSDAVTLATFNAAQFQANGFRFGDFNDNFFGNFAIADDLIKLDLTEDVELGNGLFGGAGSDLLADFDSATTQLEVRLRIDPLNVASSFNVVLLDNDGEGAGEEYQFNVGLTGQTTGEFITLTQQLTNPGPVFRQTAFNQLPGDEIQNFGLRQIQIQSVFNGTDRLKVDIDSVKLVDPGLPENPLLIELTPATNDVQPQSFDFGIFQEAGVVSVVGGNYVIDTSLAANPSGAGGLGFNGLNIDFDTAEYQIEVEAKLLPGNLAAGFNVVMGDRDGDDSGPGLGAEDYNFNIPTTAFNESGFATYTLELGSGSENSFVTQFGSVNAGDGLQNFDLTQLQIQTLADETGNPLKVEIVRFSIVRRPDNPLLPGDANGDGAVDLLDLDILGANFGLTTGATVGQGDFNADGAVDLLDLDILGANFGTTAPTAAIPEPAALGLAAFAALAIARRRTARS